MKSKRTNGATAGWDDVGSTDVLELEVDSQPIYPSLEDYFHDEAFDVDAFNGFLHGDGALPWVKVSIGRSKDSRQSLTPAPHDPVAQLVPFEDSVEILSLIHI